MENQTSIKEYAAARNVSYETVRKQVIKYENDLNGHIITEGRTRYLDDFAVDFLDKKRNVQAVAVIEDGSKYELRIAELSQEKEDLLKAIVSIQKESADKEERIRQEFSEKESAYQKKINDMDSDYKKLSAAYIELTNKLAELAAASASPEVVPDDKPEEQTVPGETAGDADQEPETAENNSDQTENEPDHHENESDLKQEEGVVSDPGEKVEEKKGLLYWLMFWKH